MLKKRRKYLIRYIFADYLMVVLAWAIFFISRKLIETQSYTIDPIYFNDQNLWTGIALIPLGWLMFYSIFDSYIDLFRQSRLAVFAKTFFVTFLGVFILFFVLILDDLVPNYTGYYTSFILLFGLHFLLVLIPRMIILTKTSRLLKAGDISFNTLIIGGNEPAKKLYKELCNLPQKLGNNFIGFVETNGKTYDDIDFVPKLGHLRDLKPIVEQYKIEEVIIAIETNEHKKLNSILSKLNEVNGSILIKIIPDMYDILLGTVKMNHLFGAVLIEIDQNLMPKWQIIFKRAIDIIASSIFLILFSPILFFIAVKVKLSSKGEIIFKQSRIGQFGKPFFIYKFRSMFVDSEKNGPQLSSNDDNRATKWGKVMRKWRLDELPQFWNVLKGDMSLVGPRPERQFYIDQIMERAPHYQYLLKVRPGITSWGQVKYGYASNVNEMVQRLKFDILYIENMSLALDFKILFYTLVVLYKGQGK